MLAAKAEPVRRIRPPILRAAMWIGFATVIVTMLGISHGLRPDLVQRFHDPIFAIRVAAALLTGMLAAIAAFLISLPDRSARCILLPLPGLVIWLSTISYGCLMDWVKLGPDDASVQRAMDCAATLVLVSVPLSLAMCLMMRSVKFLRSTETILCGALGVTGVTATALSLFHEIDATILILLWNLGTAGLLLIVGSMLRAKWLSRDVIQN